MLYKNIYILIFNYLDFESLKNIRLCNKQFKFYVREIFYKKAVCQSFRYNDFYNYYNIEKLNFSILPNAKKILYSATSDFVATNLKSLTANFDIDLSDFPLLEKLCARGKINIKNINLLSQIKKFVVPVNINILLRGKNIVFFNLVKLDLYSISTKVNYNYFIDRCPNLKYAKLIKGSLLEVFVKSIPYYKKLSLAYFVNDVKSILTEKLKIDYSANTQKNIADFLNDKTKELKIFVPVGVPNFIIYANLKVLKIRGLFFESLKYKYIFPNLEVLHCDTLKSSITLIDEWPFLRELRIKKKYSLRQFKNSWPLLEIIDFGPKNDYDLTPFMYSWPNLRKVFIHIDLKNQAIIFNKAQVYYIT